MAQFLSHITNSEMPGQGQQETWQVRVTGFRAAALINPSYVRLSVHPQCRTGRLTTQSITLHIRSESENEKEKEGKRKVQSMIIIPPPTRSSGWRYSVFQQKFLSFSSANGSSRWLYRQGTFIAEKVGYRCNFKIWVQNLGDNPH